MKNLVQGQEISMFKKPRGISENTIFGTKIKNGKLNQSLIVGINLLHLGILLSIYAIIYSILDNFLDENTKKYIILLIFQVIFFGVTLIFYFKIFRKLIDILFNTFLYSGNPSVVYFNDCLLFSTPIFEFLINKRIMFEGELPFCSVKRFILKNNKDVIIIIDENSELFNTEEFFEYRDSLTFELHPDLREISLQIVDELNSKVIKG